MEIDKYLKDSRVLNEKLEGLSRIVHNFIRTIPRPIVSISKEIGDPYLFASIEESDNYESIVLSYKDISNRYPEFEPFSEEGEHATVCINNKSIIDDLYFKPIENALSNSDLYEVKNDKVIEFLQKLVFDLNDIDFSFHKEFLHQEDLRDITTIRLTNFIKRIEALNTGNKESDKDLHKEKVVFSENVKKEKIDIDDDILENSNQDSIELHPEIDKFSLYLIEPIIKRFNETYINTDVFLNGALHKKTLAALFQGLKRMRYFQTNFRNYHLIELVKYYYSIECGCKDYLGSSGKGTNDIYDKKNSYQDAILRPRPDLPTFKIPKNNTGDRVELY